MTNNKRLASKVLLLLLSCALATIAIFAISSCKNKANIIRVGNMYGPTSVATNSMFEKTNDYEFTTLTDPSAVIAKLDAGDLDIALVPSNMAASLYNQQNNIKMISICNLCSIKILSQDTNIKSKKDLLKRKIYSTGQKNVVGAIVKILSDRNKSEFDSKNANVYYKNNVEEVLSNISADPSAIGIVTQPQASLMARLDNNLYEIADVASLWNDEYGKDDNPVTAVAVVRNEFLENHKDLVIKFLNDQQESIKRANENPAQVAYVINRLSNKTENMYDETDIANCKVVYIDGQEMKNTCTSFYKKIYDFDSSYIGSVVPDENFYYINAQ